MKRFPVVVKRVSATSLYLDYLARKEREIKGPFAFFCLGWSLVFRRYLSSFRSQVASATFVPARCTIDRSVHMKQSHKSSCLG